MSWTRFFRRRYWDQERARELDAYLEAETDDNIARGMSPEEAHYAAHRKLGNTTLIREEIYHMNSLGWLEALWQDLRFALRMLRKNPGFTAVAVLTLALGIGANTAIFTLLNAIMLQNLPVREPGQLVLFYQGINQGVYRGDMDLPGNVFSYPAWEYIRNHNESFESLCAFRQGSDRMRLQQRGPSEAAPSENAKAHLVSGSYFSTLGVRAAAGRILVPEDDTPAASPVGVISHSFWRRRWNLDPAVIGKAIDLSGTVFTIVGVAPKEFFGERVEAPPDFWLPLAKQPEVTQRESWLAQQDVYWLNLMGRLKPGVTMEGAQAEVNARLHQFYTAQAGAQVSPKRLRGIQRAHVQLRAGGGGISWMRVAYSEPLHILMAVVALVLLIACANVATLLLARASGRGHEWFIRFALGAGRTRLIRQLLTESILLALLGAMAGMLLAWWSVHVLVVMVKVTSVVQIKPDVRVLGFTLAISVLSGIIFGILPAVRASRAERKIGGPKQSWGSNARFKPAHALVVFQVTLSLILLVGAALLTHSLLELERQDLGFKGENILVVKTDPHLAGYKPTQLLALYREIQDQLIALPGAVSASVAGYTPISGSSSSSNFSIEGYTPPAGKDLTVYGVGVGPGFFETLGIPLLLGRTMGAQDTPASPSVAVVNKCFADAYLPGQNPLGRHLSLGAPFKAPGTEIIGVVADSRYYDTREKPKPMGFFSAWQGGGRDAYVGEFIVRTKGDPSGAAAEVRRAFNEIDNRLPILSIGTLHDQVYSSFDSERIITRLCTLFGLLALLLACIGLYGTMAYSVTQRTKEIGIRVALGAKPAQVLWIVLHDSTMLVSLGLALGLPLAVLAARAIKSFLFGVHAVDAVGIGGAVIALLAACGVAAYLPARRATKVDPMVALRYE